MDQADVLYRAFLEYRKLTSSDAACSRFREAVRSASYESERIETVSSRCIIEEDWVNRIYEGLPFIEKAIQEERQFIRQQGEVVPIEKVRRVSKGSVEHLAKHSELVTHEPKEDGTILPDKIYMVEKLSDYAVYENRFLYMLLCYLREFIEIRYAKIIELGNMYKATYVSDKEITVGKRNISYTVNFREEAKKDPYGLTGSGEVDALLQRIEEERHLVAAYLMTPLMRIVSKAPLLKPPITRTNVLKMNINFKGAAELYDYVTAYAADGYRIEYDKKEIHPLPDKIGDEFAEFASLTSFLVYEYGKGVKDILKKSYDDEEERRRLAEQEKQRQRLDALQKRIQATGKGADEYMLLLEERNRSLEIDRVKLGEARVKLGELSSAIDAAKKKQKELLSTIDDLKESNSEKEQRIHDMAVEHEETVARMIKEAEEEVERLNTEHSERLAAVEQECVETVDRAKQECADELTKTKQECSEAVSKAKQECSEAVTTAKRECAEAVDAANKDRDQRVGDAETKLALLRKKESLLRAELLGIKQSNGSVAAEGDFTSRERFEELERAYDALGEFIKAQWKLTKKQIRKKVLWKKYDKMSESDRAENDMSELIHSDDTEKAEKTATPVIDVVGQTAETVGAASIDNAEIEDDSNGSEDEGAKLPETEQ